MPYSQNLSSLFTHVILVIALSTLAGCADFYPIEKQSPVKDEFITLAEDDRVLYQQGTKAQALLIQSVLDEQIRNIEKAHGKPFLYQPIVHLCDTRKCFAEYTGINASILAAVTSNGLFLRSYVITHEDYSRWLAHELSHLHFRQQVSAFKTSFIPQWYQDGLATYASNGGGANKISREKAIEYILQDKHIIAIDSSSLLSDIWPLNYTASKDDWPKAWYQQHMNYRQASLLYEFLHPRGGNTLIRALEKGEDFGQAFLSVYGKTPAEMFSLYKRSLVEDENI
ncbi:hypothetical protein [Litoribacillus peritrichatus]|uniref:DUF4157 domain-containing protein n=1 Tax=Litoribacillus peritrichatus TaxID=718191 RepID=A0ABP7N9W1_9GAMM